MRAATMLVNSQWQGRNQKTSMCSAFRGAASVFLLLEQANLKLMGLETYLPGQSRLY